MLRLFARASHDQEPLRRQCALCRAAFLFGMPIPPAGEVVTLAAGELPCLFCGTAVPSGTGTARRSGRADPLLRL